MTVEFVKSESSAELEERWENEGNFYSGDAITECIEQRYINEYSLFASESIVGYECVYNDAMSILSQKVLSS